MQADEEQFTNQSQEVLIEKDGDIKKIFKATEIVTNDLPRSIEFWAEATCLNEGLDSIYKFDDSLKNYSFDACEEGEIGTHGGCGNCKMSKIKLVKTSECVNNQKKYYKFGDNNLFFEVNYFSKSDKYAEDCKYCEVKINGNNVSQKIESYCEDVSFDNDYNFDGFNDIGIKILLAQNNSSRYYLYDQKENGFIFNKELSELTNVSVDKIKKLIRSSKVAGAGNWIADYYIFKNGKFVISEKEECSEGCNCGDEIKTYDCPKKITYDKNGSIGRWVIGKDDADRRYGDGSMELMREAAQGNTENVVELIKYGAYIDASDNNGETALMWAVKNNKIDIVKILIKNGADINLKNNDNKAALDIAQVNHYEDISKELDQNVVYGNDILLRDESGMKKGNYKIDGGIVYFYNSIVKGADLDTFQVLNGYYAKDKNKVYLGDQETRYSGMSSNRLDVATFKLLNDYYAKDKSSIYVLAFDHSEEVSLLDGADIGTFEALDLYAKDKNKVYWFGRDIGADASTFQILTYGYAKDMNNVYCYDYPVCNNVISGADVKTFQVVNSDYAKDKNSVYYWGKIKEGNNPVDCTKENLSGCE
ncbi:MAG: DKNYY domain-containing protein [Candidatus Pacebacteria bacterium]|nr:DKNYY domain-containing protein [Candidatus Paceibacterota bacterium]